MSYVSLDNYFYIYTQPTIYCYPAYHKKQQNLEIVLSGIYCNHDSSRPKFQTNFVEIWIFKCGCNTWISVYKLNACRTHMHCSLHALLFKLALACLTKHRDLVNDMTLFTFGVCLLYFLACLIKHLYSLACSLGTFFTHVSSLTWMH